MRGAKDTPLGHQLEKVSQPWALSPSGAPQGLSCRRAANRAAEIRDPPRSLPTDRGSGSEGAATGVPAPRLRRPRSRRAEALQRRVLSFHDGLSAGCLSSLLSPFFRPAHPGPARTFVGSADPARVYGNTHCWLLPAGSDSLCTSGR